MTAFVNPLAGDPVALVSAVGAAEGARGAAAALACAGTAIDRAGLLIDVGGRPPRPTLLASAPAQRLEERLVAQLPGLRVAARGQVCHLAVAADEDGLAAAAAAVTVARGSGAVLHLPAGVLRAVLEGSGGLRPTAALLRADLAADRALAALATRELIERGLSVAVLKRRLSWLAERRALFGALPPETAGALPPRLLRRLLSHECYGGRRDPEADPTRAAQPERRDHASAGSR
jgi:hypothetical protein